MHGLILVALLASGAIERGEVAFRPTAAEAAVPERFRLEAADFGFEMEPLRTTERYTVAAVRFPSPVVTPDPENNTVHAEYFRPVGPGRRPAVVVLHILGADFALSRYLAARLADRGVAALFVKLPYYGERRPPGGRSGSSRPTSNARSWRWARASATSAARRPGSRAGPRSIPPSSASPASAWEGSSRRWRRRSTRRSTEGPSSSPAATWPASSGRCPKGRNTAQLWIESGRTLADLRTLTLPFDPLTYADRLVGKRLMMIAGNVDETIPPASARALWDAAGRPPIRWYDCGHYSAVGFLLPAIRETVEFFAADLAP